MARIRGFDRSTHQGGIHPTEVDCEYAVVNGYGERLLSLSTFGSDQRASRRKVSQTLQLDRKAARDLLGIVEEAFPGLRP